MARYTKQNFEDAFESSPDSLKLHVSHRGQRKSRGHKVPMAIGRSRREDRSGWAYAKRRSSVV